MKFCVGWFQFLELADSTLHQFFHLTKFNILTLEKLKERQIFISSFVPFSNVRVAITGRSWAQNYHNNIE
jgi:hypothetical protein